MNAKEIYDKIKVENMRNEKKLEKKIIDGNYNLKHSLEEIRKDMERNNNHRINYNSFKNFNFKNNKIFDLNYNINYNNDYYNKDIKDNNINNKEEIKSITVFDIEQLKLNNEKELSFLKDNLLKENIKDNINKENINKKKKK